MSQTLRTTYSIVLLRRAINNKHSTLVMTNEKLNKGIHKI